MKYYNLTRCFTRNIFVGPFLLGFSKFLGLSEFFMAHSKKIARINVTRINVWAIFFGDEA